MPDGSQLLINTETFFISDREGQGVGEELVREIGPGRAPNCFSFLRVRAFRQGGCVGGVLAWENIRQMVLL